MTKVHIIYPVYNMHFFDPINAYSLAQLTHPTMS